MNWSEKTYSLLLALLCCLPLAAQTRKVQNRPFIDERRFHYGFTVGLHDQSVKVRNNGYIEIGRAHV